MIDSCNVCGWAPFNGSTVAEFLESEGKTAKCPGLVFAPANGWLRRMTQCGADLYAQALVSEGKETKG